MVSLIQPRIGYGLRHPALLRLDALGERLAQIRAAAPPINAPAFADRTGEIYFDFQPEIELDAPPETESAPDVSTPAPLEMIEEAGVLADVAVERRAELRQKIREYQIERAGLRIERAELREASRETQLNCRDEFARIEARLDVLDDYLTMEPDTDFEATPWGDCEAIDESEIEPLSPVARVQFRGSALCRNGVLIGKIETDADGDFTPIRKQGRERVYQVQPFWGELPEGSFHKRCDGLRKQTAFVVLETVLALDPAHQSEALELTRRHFCHFANSFLSALPVEAHFTGADVLAWLEAKGR